MISVSIIHGSKKIMNEFSFLAKKKNIQIKYKHSYHVSCRTRDLVESLNEWCLIKLINFITFSENTKLHVKFWYDHVNGDDGKVHWKIRKHDIKYEVERAYFRLENLLGDKNIGKFDQVLS